MEEWKDVKDYEGLYQISNKGNLKSMDMYVLCRGGNRRFIKGKILNKRYCPNGYIQYVLCKDRNKKYVYAHQLVASAFVKNPNNYPQVNHKDENKHNNHYSNLEWCTQRYNNTYGTKIERGVKNCNYALIAAKNNKPILQYTGDNILVKRWRSVLEAAKTLSISKSDIVMCCKNKRIKTAGGYIWKYADARM